MAKVVVSTKGVEAKSAAWLDNGNLTGTGNHGHIVILHKVDEASEAELATGDFDGERFAGSIKHAGAEDVAELQDFLFLVIEFNADEDNLAVDGGNSTEVDYFYHVDQLAELLDNLVKFLAVFIHINGHAGEAGVLTRCYIEGMDVVTTPGEKIGHAGKPAKLILNKYRDSVGVIIGRRHILFHSAWEHT